MMPAPEIVLPVAGLVLYALLAVLIERRARRLMLSRPDVFVIISIHGYRAAMDTLLLILVWTLVAPGLSISPSIPLLGTPIPTSYLLILFFTLFMWANFRVWVYLGIRKREE